MPTGRDFKPMDRTVLKMKMSAPVAAYTKGKPIVALKLPIFPEGTRIWMVEFCGAPTGRADLCTVLGTHNNLLYLDRRMCWQSHKYDDDLSEISLTVDPVELKMADKSCIPKEEEVNPQAHQTETSSGSELVSTGEQGSGERAEAPEAS